MGSKVNIRIGKNSVPVSIIFLNALSVVKFGVKYGPNTKKQIAKIIRELMENAERVNTNAIYEAILLEILPKTKREIVITGQTEMSENAKK